MSKSYTVSEVAKKLGYSNNSIYGFLKDGLIKGVRIGKGKFRIPESEIEKFEVSKSERPVASSATGLSVPVSAVLPTPRPGKSLSDLSGETAVHTLKLWFGERVGLPKLFDWLTSLTSIILGVSLFLYSSQMDVLSVGRLSIWMNPIRLAMIFGGIGLILAAMVQEEVGSKLNITNLFRYTLAAAFLGLSIVLLASGDIDGCLIHGLFGLAILVEALTGVRSSTVYMLYIFGLLISVFVVYSFFPEGSGLSMITAGLRSILGGLGWILSVVIFILIMAGLYGYFLDKKFLKNVSFIYGVLLCVLALYYGVGNYWSRAFAMLLAGMIGMILPSWEKFKARLASDRSLVFKMFGSVLICFSIPILLISVVQGTLIKNAYRGLADKAEFAKVELENTISDLEQGGNDLASNSNFVTAFVAGQGTELANQLRFLSMGRPMVAVVGLVNSNGKGIASYPAAQVFSTFDFSTVEFLTSVMKTGNSYISNNLESLLPGVNNDLLVAVPALNKKGVTTGTLVVALSGVNMTNELHRVGQKTLGQGVMVVGEGGKAIVHPNVNKLGQVLNEADGSYILWKTGLANGEGYSWNGVHSLFGASVSSKYGMTVIVFQPLQKVLDISASWLAWLLFFQLIIGMVVFISFMYVKNTKIKEED
jgi:excisionase family DNA binding protein